MTTWFFSHRDIVTPIVNLRAQIEKVRSGEFGAKLPLSSRDEIGDLARSFNLMTENLEKVTVSRDFMNSVLEASPFGVFITDENGEPQYSNRQFEVISGRTLDGIKGKGWHDLIHPDDLERLSREWAEAIREKRGFQSTHRFLKGGDVLWVRVITAPMVDAQRAGFIGSVEDITQQKKLESTVRQSEKMAAVGQLAGGIAHDLNNGLTPVMGYLDMLLLDATGPNAVLLNEAKYATQRCADVVRQLLNFGRPTTQTKTSLPVSRLCEEFKRLTHTILPPTITVNIECASDAGLIDANETDLINVLMNLAINAKDAMHSAGSLTVTAARVRASHTADEPRDHVLITVTDTGDGIPPDIAARIFEPFFTTKDKGKGTGLGLAMVYNTIKDHDGWVEVSSIVGRGTTFQIYIPISMKIASADSSEAGDKAAALPRGEGVILFVDDEEALRTMGKNFLERVGYTVLSASNGEQAVELFSNCLADIKAVVMDITMPKLSGIEAMKKMLAIDPKAKIILASGYTSEGTPKELAKAGAAAFLPKPYTIGPLTQALHRVISGNA